MHGVFEKLNWKDQHEIVVLNAPESFSPELARLPAVTIHKHVDSLPKIDFALVFVTRKAEVEAIVPRIVALAKGDAIIWFAYPKQSAKQYKCDFSRDTGWDALKAAGFNTVRAVAIDETWSALRFRRVEFIRTR